MLRARTLPSFRHLAAATTVLLGAGLSAQRPEVTPTRLAEGEEITVDGELDEPAWERAAVLGELTQVEPVEGAAPSRETIVRLCYDADHLYIALDCRDDPAEVRARLMVRDAQLDPDDRVELWLDTYDTRAFGFWFQIGAGGSKGDALLSDGGARFNKQWDGIWYGRSRVTARGWQAELALPFKTLGFREGHPTWGFNLRRLRKASGEDMRWASPRLAHRFFTLSVGGTLTGLEGLRQGLGIDVVPYAKFRASRDRREDLDTSSKGEWGMDLRYKITPSLDLLLTYDTDFAETEVDERQVNLTRFPLFFPEKRDFFLEDAGLFEFGPPSGFGRSSDLIPFFSRRIGIDGDGDPVPILGGVKVTGRAADWNVGTLGVLQDETALDSEKMLGVARLSRNIGEESSVGLIATGGRPTGSGDAATAGVDFRLQDSELFGPARSGALWGYWLGTYNAGQDDGAAFGVLGQARTTDWEHELSFDAIGAGFDPRLGFVRRAGIRRYRTESEYTWRPNGAVVRNVEVRVEPSLTTTTGNDLDTWSVPVRWFEVELASLDRFELETERRFERVPEFELRDGVTVTAGDYTMTRHRGRFRSDDSRAVSAGLELEYGDFFSGRLTRWSVESAWLPGRYVRLAGEYEQFEVRLKEGGFTARVTEGRVDVTPSPRLAWRNLVQYDTESKDLTFQSRLHWILEPGHDLFLLAVYGWNREEHAAPLLPTTQDFTVKFSYTFRF